MELWGIVSLARDATIRTLIREVIDLSETTNNPIETRENQSFTVQQVNLLAIFALGMGGLMILSNLLAAKLWGFDLGALFGLDSFWVSFDAGLLVYPLTYILGDMLVELFGRKTANRVAWGCAGLNLLAFCAMKVADLLPALQGVDNVNFDSALGLSSLVFLGSTIAFLVSQLVNNGLFEMIRHYKGENNLFSRVIGSSLIARVVDLVLFDLIAFGGRLDHRQLLIQMFFAYVAGMALELAFYPLTKLGVKWSCRRLDF